MLAAELDAKRFEILWRRCHGQDETVYVSAAKDVRLFYDPLRVYKVRGLFEARVQTDPAHGVSLFRLRQAHVEEAVGAKIMPVEDTPAAPR